VGLYDGSDSLEPVTDRNKGACVRARAHRLLLAGRLPELQALHRGFACVPELAVPLQLFSAQELSTFACGLGRLTAAMVLQVPPSALRVF
jgi:hypothetical protein